MTKSQGKKADRARPSETAAAAATTDEAIAGSSDSDRPTIARSNDAFKQAVGKSQPSDTSDHAAKASNSSDRPQTTTNTDINYVDYLLPHDELYKDDPLLLFNVGKAFAVRHGVIKAADMLKAWLDQRRRLPLGIARDIYMKPSIPESLPPFRRGQELYGYSFEAQAAAAVLAGTKDAEFSFQAVCDLISEGVDHHSSVLVGWREYPELFGQAMSDANNNIPGNIREEYRVLIQLARDLRERIGTHLILAYAQGPTARLIKPDPGQKVEEWGKFTFGFALDFVGMTQLDPLSGTLLDFAVFDYPSSASRSPVQQTILMLEYTLQAEAKKGRHHTPHVNRLLNKAISANALIRECMRACPDFTAMPSLLNSPQSTWPTSFVKRVKRYFDIMNYLPVAEAGADPIWFTWSLKADGVPVSGYGNHFTDVMKKMEAKFGRLDMYIVPSTELARQPYWHPEEPTLPTEHIPAPPVLLPFADTPIIQSGHAYRQEHGIAPNDLVQNLEAVTISPRPVEVIKPTCTIFTVNSALYNVAKNLLGTSKKATAGQMRWDQIVSLMRHIGFKVEASGGSMYRFTPPKQAGRPFVEHSPHPEPTFDKIRYRTLGKRLQRLYGWELDWFVRSEE